MKWLTREWASGDLEDDERESISARYGEYLASIVPRLSGGAEYLATELSMHDAQVCAFDRPDNSSVHVRALVGDLQTGYQFVDLTYRDAELVLDPGVTVDSLNLLAPKTEVIYEEVDLLPDGRFAHRLLLWPNGEYEIRFKGLSVALSPAEPSDRQKRRAETASVARAVTGRLPS